MTGAHTVAQLLVWSGGTVALALTPYAVGMEAQHDGLQAIRMLVTALVCWLAWDTIARTRPTEPAAWALAIWFVAAAMHNAQSTWNHMGAPVEVFSYVGAFEWFAFIGCLVLLPRLPMGIRLGVFGILSVSLLLTGWAGFGVRAVAILAAVGLGARQIRPRSMSGGVWAVFALFGLLDIASVGSELLAIAYRSLQTAMMVLVPIAIVTAMAMGRLWSVEVRWSELLMHIPLAVVFVAALFGLSSVLPVPDRRDGLNADWTYELAQRGVILSGLIGALMPTVRMGLARMLPSRS